MNVTITNDKIEVVNPTASAINFAKTNLSYVDKSKLYQIKRMERNPWQANSRALLELKKSVNGTLYTIDGNTLTMPQGFYDEFRKAFPDVEVDDRRKETGNKIIVPWVNKPLPLREYQKEAVEMLLQPDRHRGVVNFATGLGKTLTITHFIQKYKRNTLIVCPSDSVAKQFYEQLEHLLGRNKVGFYGGGKKKIADITVGIAASVTRNVEAFQKVNLGLVVFDEIHHIAADTFYKIAGGLSNVGKLFGLTATDYRSDGKDIMITGGCGPVLVRRDIWWGVKNGFLAEPYFIIREVDTTDAIDCGENKLKNYKEHVLNHKGMKNQILNDARKMMSAGRSVLILVDEVQHGRELSTQLGIPFATGEDPNSQEYVNQLNANKIPGLVGTDGRIGEGTDTRNVDVLILANFVASKGPVIQAVGRGLRKTDTKDKCIILDYIPKGSSMLTRHAKGRIKFYDEITNNVKILPL